MAGAIDLFLSPRHVEVDTGHQNPHYGHWCTYKATAVEAEQLGERERRALAAAKAAAARTGAALHVHLTRGRRARFALLRRGIVRLPAVLVNGVRLRGPATAERLERALRTTRQGRPVGLQRPRENGGPSHGAH